MTSLLELPRGIRNNNPGNIKDFDIPWDGLVDVSNRPEELQDEKTFCVFSHPWYGIRVIVKQLVRNHDVHGCRTLHQQFKRWAPGDDGNPTAAYLNFVSGRTGFPGHASFPVRNFFLMRKLVEAIIHFENGYNPYTWEIEVGFALADFDPSVRMENYAKPS